MLLVINLLADFHLLFESPTSLKASSITWQFLRLPSFIKDPATGKSALRSGLAG